MKTEVPVKVREMAIVGRRVSFAEAEEIGNEYWRNASVDERSQNLIELNYMVFGKEIGKIAKVVNRRHLNNEAEDRSPLKTF